MTRTRGVVRFYNMEGISLSVWTMRSVARIVNLRLTPTSRPCGFLMPQGATKRTTNHHDEGLAAVTRNLRRSRSTTMPLRGLVTVAAAVLGLAACSTTSSTTGGSASDSSSSASSASSSGGDVTCTVPQQEGTALPYVATSSNGQLEGILPAMALAEGTALGGRTKNVTTSFESSLLGLTRHIYAWVPGADVTAVRLKSFDFATTLRDSYAFVAPAGGVTIGNSMMDLCGHSVGVVAASSPVAVLQTQSTTCTTAGKKPIGVQTFADYATADLAAKSHRVDVAVLSTSTAGYQIKTDPGVWKETGPKFDYVIIGDATPKGNGMAQKLAVAINKLIADGTYAKILAQWGASGLAITKSVVNPAPEG